MSAHDPDKGQMLAPAATARALTFDAAAYVHFLNDTDWTESQKREFTEALWQIVVGFVDLGFGLNAVQQIPPNESLLETDSPSMLDSMNTEKFNDEKDSARQNTRAVLRTDS